MSGQTFSGVVPGPLVGVVSYLVRATDEQGNVGVSQTLQFVSGTSETYCTAGTSASGCQALISTSGGASATASSGFVVSVSDVEGSKDGQFYFGQAGRQGVAWGNGTSYQCVVPPVKRGGLLTGSGSNGGCDGSFVQDFNARWQAKPAQNPGVGTTAQAQLWYRDPSSTSNQTTSLSDAIEFTVCP